MEKKIFLISGKKGSGKTTLSDAIKSHINLHNPEPLTWMKDKTPLHETIKFADPLYEAHHKVWDVIDRYKVIPREEKSRDLLQYLGDFGRARDINLFANIARAAVDASKAEVILIDDLRYLSEMEAIPFNAVRIRLECPEDIRKQRCVWGNSQHSSETSLDHLVGYRNLFEESVEQRNPRFNKEGVFDYIFDSSVESVNQILEVLTKAHPNYFYNLR